MRRLSLVLRQTFFLDYCHFLDLDYFVLVKGTAENIRKIKRIF
jgi:hypothetical protein